MGGTGSRLQKNQKSADAFPAAHVRFASPDLPVPNVFAATATQLRLPATLHFQFSRSARAANPERVRCGMLHQQRDALQSHPQDTADRCDESEFHRYPRAHANLLRLLLSLAQAR